MFAMDKSLRIDTVIPINLLNNPLASCSLIKFHFFYYQTLHILIKLLFFDFNLYDFWIFTFCSFSTFQTMR